MDGGGEVRGLLSRSFMRCARMGSFVMLTECGRFRSWGGEPHVVASDDPDDADDPDDPDDPSVFRGFGLLFDDFAIARPLPLSSDSRMDSVHSFKV